MKKCKHRLPIVSCMKCFVEIVKVKNPPDKFINYPKEKRKKSNPHRADMKEIRVKIMDRKQQIELEQFLLSLGYEYEYDLPEMVLE